MSGWDAASAILSSDIKKVRIGNCIRFQKRELILYPDQVIQYR